jgi:hypothetical protein
MFNYIINSLGRRGEIGRHNTLKQYRPHGHVGSTPTVGTEKSGFSLTFCFAFAGYYPPSAGKSTAFTTSSSPSAIF